MIARNADVSVVNVTVELPEDGLLEAVAEVAEFGRTVAAEAEERFPGMDFRLVGTAMVNQTFLEASIESQMIFLPVSLCSWPWSLASLPGAGRGWLQRVR